MDSDLETFCRTVRERSREHRASIEVLYGADLLGTAVGILRQELDSLVRVIYLLSISDREKRRSIISASVAGGRWGLPGSARITDRQMVELASALHGWTGSVYRFSCAFIHLSSHHDYRTRDPVETLSEPERADLLHHLRYYHGGPESDDFTFAEIARYIPRVFTKISSNLDSYLRQLEQDEQLDEHSLPAR